MDADIEKRFDDLMSFLHQHMVTKAEFNELKEEVVRHGIRLDQLTIAVDNLTKLTKEYYEEMAVLRHKVERKEKWILQVAETTGVKYEA